VFLRMIIEIKFKKKFEKKSKNNFHKFFWNFLKNIFLNFSQKFFSEIFLKFFWNFSQKYFSQKIKLNSFCFFRNLKFFLFFLCVRVTALYLFGFAFYFFRQNSGFFNPGHFLSETLWEKKTNFRNILTK